MRGQRTGKIEIRIKKAEDIVWDAIHNDCNRMLCPVGRMPAKLSAVN
ncbi:MAG: hypothetical protein MJB12_09865 [Firmicutes bacterium]|nr:hypothetical protein [Bacillota bacterium]